AVHLAALERQKAGDAAGIALHELNPGADNPIDGGGDDCGFGGRAGARDQEFLAEQILRALDLGTLLPGHIDGRGLAHAAEPAKLAVIDLRDVPAEQRLEDQGATEPANSGAVAGRGFVEMPRPLPATAP